MGNIWYLVGTTLVLQVYATVLKPINTQRRPAPSSSSRFTSLQRSLLPPRTSDSDERISLHLSALLHSSTSTLQLTRNTWEPFTFQDISTSCRISPLITINFAAQLSLLGNEGMTDRSSDLTPMVRGPPSVKQRITKGRRALVPYGKVSSNRAHLDKLTTRPTKAKDHMAVYKVPAGTEGDRLSSQAVSLLEGKNPLSPCS